MGKVKVLILGTGGMAASHAEAFQQNPLVDLVAGVDTNPDLLELFCTKHAVPNRFTSLDAVLDWDGFDAVANVTPDAVHYPTTMKLLAAGKHVLCEKPLATNHAHAVEMAVAADKSGVINMVNLTYRNVAALQQARKIVAEGKIGTCRHFEASYLQSWLTQPAWGDWRSEEKWLWRLSTAHGSKGVLGDVGIHIVDFACFVADSLPTQVSCKLKTFDKAPGNRIGDYVLDANDSCAMTLELGNGAVGTVSATRFASGHHNDLRLRLYGDRGGLEVGFEKAVGHLRLCAGEDMATQTWRDLDIPPTGTIYDAFIAAINDGVPRQPDFQQAARLQKVLDLAESSDAQNGLSLAV